MPSVIWISGSRAAVLRAAGEHLAAAQQRALRQARLHRRELGAQLLVGARGGGEVDRGLEERAGEPAPDRVERLLHALLARPAATPPRRGSRRAGASPAPPARRRRAPGACRSGAGARRARRRRARTRARSSCPRSRARRGTPSAASSSAARVAARRSSCVRRAASRSPTYDTFIRERKFLTTHPDEENDRGID